MEILENLVYERIKHEPFTPFVQEKCFDPKIFSWDDVNIVFNNSQIMKNSELVGLDQRKIPLNRLNYPWQRSVVDRDQIFYGAINGFTVVVLNLSTYNKKIQEICYKLENIFNGASDVHLYFSLLTISNSFGIHNDEPHNLIIQTEGECEWKVWNTNKKEETYHPPIIHTVLGPGDAVYVPSKIYHQCIPMGRRASISIPTHPNIQCMPRRFYDIECMKSLI
jgi:ribosomal protein L16 Arg81 hydroxylase